MTEAKSTKDWRDFKASDLPEEYKNKCFACGSPVEWPHDICDSCKKLTELNCSWRQLGTAFHPSFGRLLLHWQESDWCQKVLCLFVVLTTHRQESGGGYQLLKSLEPLCSPKSVFYTSGEQDSENSWQKYQAEMVPGLAPWQISILHWMQTGS